MKRVSILFLTVLLTLLLALPAMAGVTVYVDGQQVQFDQQPYVDQEAKRTLVPFRQIFEALGAEVWYDDASNSAMGQKDGLTIQLPIDQAKALVNNKEISLDVASKVVNGRTMVPLRFISENLGCTVTPEGDLDNLTVYITSVATPQAGELTTEEHAFQAILTNLGVIYDANKINEIAQAGRVTIDDQIIVLEGTSKINNKEFVQFGVAGVGGGAHSTYLVSIDTGAVYNDYRLYGILEEFNLDSLNYENIFDRKLYSLTIEYNAYAEPYTRHTYIDGTTNKSYYDLDSARQEIMEELLNDHPLLSLAGKDSSSIQSITGQPVQRVTREMHDDLGDSFDVELTLIEYHNATIYFENDGSFNMIALGKEADLLGAKPGMTFSEIKKILGVPDHEGQLASGWDDYTLLYRFGNKEITFFADTANGPTTGASIHVR